MMLNKDLPKKIPVFPLSNFIIFPKTTVPLNIFEPRYIQMIDDSMKSNRYIGMIQPKKTGDLKKPDLYNIGCVGKITSFNETEDLENQSVEQTLNTLSMASPFTLEEKQILLETQNLTERKNKLEEILVTYTNYNFTNKTIQ